MKSWQTTLKLFVVLGCWFSGLLLRAAYLLLIFFLHAEKNNSMNFLYSNCKSQRNYKLSLPEFIAQKTFPSQWLLMQRVVVVVMWVCLSTWSVQSECLRENNSFWKQRPSVVSSSRHYLQPTGRLFRNGKKRGILNRKPSGSWRVCRPEQQQCKEWRKKNTKKLELEFSSDAPAKQ